MDKLASYSYDVLDHIINNEIEPVAEVVKGLSKTAQTAEIPYDEELENKDDSDFALILNHPAQGEMRKFAKFTPQLVEINVNLLAKKEDQLPEQIFKVAAANLGRAALDYGMDVPENVRAHVGEYFIDNHVDISDVEKTASYSELRDGSDGPYALEDQKKYPISSPGEVEKAAEYFRLHHRIFDMDEKLAFARATHKQAQQFEIDLEDTLVEKYASLTTTEFNEEFKTHLQARKSYISDNADGTHTSVYDDLLEKSAELGPERTVNALAEIDKKTGTWTSWGKGLADPLLATLGEEKVAARKIEGEVVSLNDLRGLDDADLTAVVGNNAIKSLKGDDGLDVLASLPRPVKLEVLKLIR